MTQNVLITGCSSGFGLLSAERFARAGWKVHASLRSPQKAAALEKLKGEGLPIEIVELDVTEPKSVQNAVAAASAAEPIDALVNNAGFEVSGPVEDLTDDLMLRQFDTNVAGVVRMVRAVVPAMRRRGSGRIINVSSVAGQIASPFSGAYSASKHALEALSESLWYELRPFGVGVVLIEPGGFPTSFSSNIIEAPAQDASSPYEAMRTRFREAMAGFSAGPPQDPKEVAALVFQAATDPDPKLRMLAGDDARMLVPLRQSLGFEGFSAAMIGRLGLADILPPPAAGG
ncbi:MAG: SDR family oxidoreductase [Caulobacteraceae bacterium]